MQSGVYKHPWELESAQYNDPKGLEAVKGKNYVEFASVPKGLRSRY
jgi:hypothetical protein